MSAEVLLFAGLVYYPRGGFLDFVGAFDSVGEAKAAHAALKHVGLDWAQIAELAQGGRLITTYESEGYPGRAAGWQTCSR